MCEVYAATLLIALFVRLSVIAERQHLVALCQGGRVMTCYSLVLKAVLQTVRCLPERTCCSISDTKLGVSVLFLSVCGRLHGDEEMR